MAASGKQRGVVVRSRSVVGTFGASLQTLIGGNISLFTELAERTRQQAFDTMLIQAHLAGQPQDLRDLPLDFSGVQDFERRVYAAARALDPGQTCTYGEMAHAIGQPAALRAVGQALGHNPWPLVIPCHRVLAAGGRLGGFSAPGGSETKRRLLVLEMGMFRREGELF